MSGLNDGPPPPLSSSLACQSSTRNKNKNKNSNRNRNRNSDALNRTTLAHHLFPDPNSNKENQNQNYSSNETVSVSNNNRSKLNSNVNVVPLGDNNSRAAASVKDSADKLSSSLQVCMQFNNNVWDHSDSEAAAPASSWSTLPNRSLLCRPLPLDIGRCTCVIVKEKSPLSGFLYALYTNEGHGRQDRKLAVAHHRRRNGRSEFTVAQNTKGLLCSSDESILGTITANLMGSKYHIWDQGTTLGPLKKQSKLLLAVVGFVPTVTTCTGCYRSLRAWIPKYQSMQLKNTSKIEHINGLPKVWEANANRTQQLYSRVPNYNKFSRQYELDFRESGTSGFKIQCSVKNFQLTVEENGRQSILQLGRIGKSKYVMDYRYPLTGYQAFSICLAAIDSKLCCTV